MMRSREVLLQLLHDPRYDIGDAQVWFVDRGAPGDTTRIPGRDVVSAESLYFKVATPSGAKEIPYHRILRIVYCGEILWDRTWRRKNRTGDTG
ncbi:MAG: DUF504 domain-containing protein [Methanolinea sp.]|nr:DUF504 domain-containing protein [Methanolinea sp.]